MEASSIEARVRDLREQRCEALARVVESKSPTGSNLNCHDVGLNLRYAILSHAAATASLATTVADSNYAEEAFRIASGMSEFPIACDRPEPLIAVQANECRPWKRLDNHLVPYTLKVPSKSVGSGENRQLLCDASAKLDLSSEKTRLGSWPGVLVFLKDVDLETDGRFSSYTLRNVYGTVYMDRPVSAVAPLVVAETFLHESAHSWLNDALHAVGERLPPDPQWFSPWTDCDRPAFGILHGAFAFSLVIRFLRDYASTSQCCAAERSYCERSLQREGARLARGHEAFRSSLRLIRSKDLSEVLRSTYVNADEL